VTVGLFTILYGTYSHYLPAWIDAVQNLETKPDQVIVATDLDVDVPSWIEIVKPYEINRYPIPAHANAACDALHTEWMWRMDIDDRIRPDALSVIRDDADVVTTWYENQHGYIHMVPAGDISCEEILNAQCNLIVSASPFRRWLHEQAPFPDIAHEDWGLWKSFARLGARFRSANKVTHDYDFHPNTSISGLHANEENFQEALRW
jgi:hypothetical protein